jgi:hypothetical protein
LHLFPFRTIFYSIMCVSAYLLENVK